MAKSVISGITVEIGADTKKFSTAIKDLNKQAKAIAGDLKQVSESLKLDPGESQKYAEKMKLLSEAVSTAKTKVDTIKQAIDKLNKEFEEGEANQREYNRALIEINEALTDGKIDQETYDKNLKAIDETYKKGTISQQDYERTLADLNRQLQSAVYEYDNAYNALDKFQKENEDTAKAVDKLGDEQEGTNKEVREMEGATKQAHSGVKLLGEGIAKYLTADHIRKGFEKILNLAKNLAKHLIDAGKELAKFSYSAIEDAASFEDALGYATTIYGDKVGEQVKKWVTENSNALRIYKGDLLENVNTFGQLFQTMSLGSEESFNMATNIVSLAADLRAATGKETTDILESLASGFTNTTRALRQFGVRIGEAEIKAYALDKGIIQVEIDQTKLRDATLKVHEAVKKQEEAYDEHGESSLEYERATVNVTKAEENLEKVLGGKVPTLTAAERATAIYMAMLEQLEPVIGQNERESGLFNSQLAEARTRLQNLKETIGEQLLPVATDLLTKINEFLDSEAGQKLQQQIVDQFKVWADTIKEMMDDGRLTTFLSDLIDKLPKIAENIGTLITKALELVPKLSNIADEVLKIIGSVDKMRTDRAWDNAEERIEKFADKYQLKTGTAKDAIAAFATASGEDLSTVLNNFEQYEPFIVDYLASIGSNATNMEETTKSALQKLPQDIQDGINEARNIDLSPLQTIAARVGEIVSNIISDVDYAGNSINSGPWEQQKDWKKNFNLNDPILSGSYANGGLAQAGRMIRVNDNAGGQIEGFIPFTDGYVLNGNQVDRMINSNNNNSRNFNGGINIYVTSTALSVDDLANDLGEAMNRKLRMSGAIL